MPPNSTTGVPKRAIDVFKAAVVVIVAVGVAEELRSMLRRMARRPGWWLSSAEQRDLRRFRMEELAFLVREIDARKKRG